MCKSSPRLTYSLCHTSCFLPIRVVSGQGRLHKTVRSRLTKPCSARAPAADDSGTGRQKNVSSRIATGRAERAGKTLIQQHGCGTDVGSNRTLTARELFLVQGGLASPPVIINSRTLAETRRAWMARVCKYYSIDRASVCDLFTKLQKEPRERQLTFR